MGLHSEQEKNSLKESLKNTDDLNQTIFCLECILKYKTPFALYIATADKTNCSWIFDKDIIYSMLGGEDKYKKIQASTDSENSDTEEVTFFIFKKVGPIYAVKVDIEVIDQIINELYDEL